MTRDEIMKIIEEKNVNFFRLQFVDIFGFMKNVSIPRSQIDKALDGKMMFDGSSIDGFVRINTNRICTWCRTMTPLLYFLGGARMGSTLPASSVMSINLMEHHLRGAPGLT